MERRKLIFALVVAALAAVGAYVTLLPPDSGANRPEPPAETGAVRTPTPVPTEEVTGETSGEFDIYPLLPLTEREFADAAGLVREFTAAYASYRYDEGPEEYGRRLSGMTTEELAGHLVRGASSPARAEEIARNKEVAVGTARLDSIRDMATDSVIFVVTATQRITSEKGKEERTAEYAVTAAKIGGTWKIHDVEPADVGQEGDS